MKELVVVTGGSGFIGTNLIERLLELDFDVINIDKEPPMNNSQFKFHKKIDLLNKEELCFFFNSCNPDYIVHLAARTDLNGKSLNDYDINIKGIENLCVAIEHKKCVKKILFASTMLVCKAGHIPVKNDDFSADTLYGKSKIKGEKLIRKYANNIPDFYIFRPTSIWGPWFKAPYKDFFEMCLSEKYVKVGKRSSIKTYGFVGNASNQIISLFKNTDKSITSDSLIYVGDLDPINVDEWSEKICKAGNKKKPTTVPFFLIKFGGFVGDFLDKLNIRFPLTSFRINNMTTNNIYTKKQLCIRNKYKHFSIEEGIVATLEWLSLNKFFK